MMNNSSSLAALLCLMCTLVNAQEKQMIFDETLLPTFSRTLPLEISITPAMNSTRTLKWTWYWSHPGDTDFLRFHIVSRELPQSSRWSLVVKDGSGDVIDELTNEDFLGHLLAGGVWTKMIHGNTVEMELKSEDDISRLKLAIDRYNSRSFNPTVKALTSSTDRRVDLARTYPPTNPFYVYSKPIAFVYFLTAKTQKESNCTGFLLSPSLILTNQHCINDPGQLRTAYIRFGYETDRPLLPTYATTQIVLQDEDLDFSLLRLDGDASAWLQTAIDPNPVKKNQLLILIQHPDGRPKFLAERGCQIDASDASEKNGNNTDFVHLCDSEGGSSGSPVMDKGTGKVVGLHHLGTNLADKTKNLNFAVKICNVLNYIRKRNDQVFAEIAKAILPVRDVCKDETH